MERACYLTVVTGVVSHRSLDIRQSNIFRTSSQQRVTPHFCQGLGFVTLNGDDHSAGIPISVPINVLVLIWDVRLSIV